MTEKTGTGAWMMRTTIGCDSESEWGQRWDPEATPVSEADVARRRERLLEILFAPRPDDPQ
jgi:hypothetical protein